MSDRGWNVLDDMTDDVHDTVIKEFKGKEEGKSDYTDEVVAFIRAVEARLKGGEDRPKIEDETSTKEAKDVAQGSKEDVPRKDDEISVASSQGPPKEKA